MISFRRKIEFKVHQSQNLVKTCNVGFAQIKTGFLEWFDLWMSATLTSHFAAHFSRYEPRSASNRKSIRSPIHSHSRQRVTCSRPEMKRFGKRCSRLSEMPATIKDHHFWHEKTLFDPFSSEAITSSKARCRLLIQRGVVTQIPRPSQVAAGLAEKWTTAKGPTRRDEESEYAAKLKTPSSAKNGACTCSWCILDSHSHFLHLPSMHASCAPCSTLRVAKHTEIAGMRVYKTKTKVA